MKDQEKNIVADGLASLLKGLTKLRLTELQEASARHVDLVTEQGRHLTREDSF